MLDNSQNTVTLPSNFFNSSSGVPTGLTMYDGMSLAGASIPVTGTGSYSLTGPTQNPAQVLGADTTNTGNYTGLGTGAAAQTALQQGAVNSVYDARASRFQNLLSGLDPQRDQALASYNMQADARMGDLTNARQQGMNNLDYQVQQNDTQRTRSYRDIASGIRNTLESASNRLGSMNATDSSASPMLAYALANLQAQQRGQANDTYGDNMGQIGLARTNMEGDFNQQLNALNAEKRSKAQEIASQYQQIHSQILDEMATSDQARQYELANLGQHYTMKAISDINSLENQYNQAAQQWTQKAVSAIPQASTQSWGQVPSQGAYGTYGQGASINSNQPASYQDAIATSPLRKIRETA